MLVLLVALAAIAVPMFGASVDSAREDATRETLRRLQHVIMNHYVIDVGHLPRDSGGVASLAGLFQPLGVMPYDRATRIGWNGPYLLHPVGQGADTATVLDGWGNPIKLQENENLGLVRLVSGGPNGTIDTQLTDSDLQEDDIALFLKVFSP